MPLLGGLLVTLFGGLATWLTGFLSLRVAIAAAGIAAFSALTLALFAAASGLASGITAAFPSIVMTGVWLMVPDNAIPCIAAIISCDTAMAIYRWNVTNVNIATSGRVL
jgi:hypothetical protein